MKIEPGMRAVVTGGGTGMGRALCLQLAREGCDVAMCDVSSEKMLQTKQLCEAEPKSGKISTFICDVSDKAGMQAFQEHVAAHHGDTVHLLFNNAGIGGGGSFVVGESDAWERTFNINFNGVYFGCRNFLPMLMKAERGYVVNTSSINGFWASLGFGRAQTAYAGNT
jgi:NAD(P)-dependent dehydrogenase (short-subunit alcohol dehydrogenase family)